MNQNTDTLTVKDLPKHHAVGRVFLGYDSQVYYCDSYDPRNDYWLVNVLDATDRKAVSPRAIGGTFHSLWDSWKPVTQEDVVGRQYDMVDLRVPPAELSVVRVDEQDCLGMDERQILFFYEGDGMRFLRKIQEAAAKRGLALNIATPSPVSA